MKWISVVGLTCRKIDSVTLLDHLIIDVWSYLRMHMHWQDGATMLQQPPVAPCTTVYPKKYAHGFCFAVLCCGYTLTDFPISTMLTSLALWQSYDCPSARKVTLMNMDKYFKWIHYERLHNHNKAKHNKTVYIFLGIYCKEVNPRLAKCPLKASGAFS